MSKSKTPQNFSNHAQLVPMYHFVGLPLLLITLIGSIVNLINTNKENLYNASLIFCICLLLIIAIMYTRLFALKAQDRAIRAEERLRYFIRTGKDLPTSLKLSQIIALRFASDNEYDVLLQQTIEQKLKAKEIKQAIKNWKPDYNRV
ncbi:MAG: DUF6526 family protein [Chitinophagaceae bacterium]